ncbi:MAG: SGNH/GDSL hydrolase family protein [Clostridia bacterium]|nr:SGNH/GDSL hydrolase family protein [Clostridia bacterium]
MSLPRSEFVPEGAFINVFKNIGCIGDSLSSGEFEHILKDGEKGYWDYYYYSWGKQIERATGIDVTNFSRGGLTAKQMYEYGDKRSGDNEDLKHVFDADNLKQAYIIALGVNDIRGKDNLDKLYGGEVGDAKTDIDISDYTKNKPTFCGVYAKIIQRIQKMQPDTKFFLVSMPNDGGRDCGFSDMLRGISKTLPNCYIIDMYHDAPKYDDEFKRSYFDGHMNVLGYIWTAHFMIRYIDNIIRKNPDDFRYVPFIGTDMTPNKNPNISEFSKTVEV